MGACFEDLRSTLRSTMPGRERSTLSTTDVISAIKHLTLARGVTLPELKRYFRKKNKELAALSDKFLYNEVARKADHCVENSLLVKDSARFMLSGVSANMVAQKKCCTRKKKSDCRRCKQVIRPRGERRGRAPLKKRVMYREKGKLVRKNPGFKKRK